jgi:Matrixin
MQIITAIVGLGLLMWVEPANAQRTQTQIPFRLTVGVHDHETVSPDRVDKILEEASKVLKKCNVVLTRKGSVGKFTAPNTAPHQEGLIKNRRDRDAVHKVEFDFKVVETPFFFCRGIENEAVMGCAFDPPPPPAKQLPQHQSMIVGNTSDLKLTAKIWAHEFGHRRGLSHRNEKNALMACKVERENDEISQHECDCIRKGPQFCTDPVEPARPCGEDVR